RSPRAASRWWLSSCGRWFSNSPTASTTPPTRSPPWSRPVSWIFRRSSPARVDGLFRRLQLLSAAAFSLGHGGNDAQKTMGIISALLIGSGHLQLEANGDLPVPNWVVIAAYSAIALGTLSGGWRIVKPLGQRIPALKPVGGFSAETAAALTYA